MSLVKHKEYQTLKVSGEGKALTKHLMERICDLLNLNKAYKRLKANKGMAGVDGTTVNYLYPWIVEHKESLITGTYQPQLVLGVEISKPRKGKGIRQLGAPCVFGHLVHQAIHQVVESFLDPTVSDSSYGFRLGRGANQALKKAQEYVKEIYGIGGSVSFHVATLATGLLTFTPAGLAPAVQTSLCWTHQFRKHSPKEIRSAG